MARGDVRKPGDGNKESAVGLVVTKAVVGGTVAAGAATLGVLGGPAAAILGAGLAPLVVGTLSELLDRRARRFRQQLDLDGVDFDRMVSDAAPLTPGAAELIREAVSAALGTDSAPKIAMLSRLLKEGLAAKLDVEVHAARRLARTVARLDEIELRILTALSKVEVKASPPQVKDIMEASGVPSADLARSALSVLVAEGLVRLEQSKQIDCWKLSDYGRRFVGDLTSAYPGA